MTPGREYKSDFARSYYNTGRSAGRRAGWIEGAADSVLAVLSARGIEVSDEVYSRIEECRNAAQLKISVYRAATVESADDLIGRDGDLFDRR
jgi:hypothetical protein